METKMKLTRHILLAVIFITLLVSCSKQETSPVKKETPTLSGTASDYMSGDEFVIQNITVIDGLGNEQKSNQDIYIKDGKIVSISPAGQNVPTTSATIVDGTGLTAMPGLMDLHIHTQGGWANGLIPGEAYEVTYDDKSVQQRLAAYLYAGVTTVLDLGADHNFLLEKRAQLKSGQLLGPRYFTVGAPWSGIPNGWESGNTGGDGDWAAATKVTDFSELPEQMKKYADENIEIIKIYSGISSMAMQEVVKEAHKYNILTVADLWGMNMDKMVMRVTGLDGWAHTGAFMNISEEDVQWMTDNNRFLISTINVGEKMAGARVADENGNRLMFNEPLIVDIWGADVVEDFYKVYPQIRENYYEGPESFYQTSNFGDLSKFRGTAMYNVKAAYDAGMLIAGGTDDIYASLWPGESMHREMELLVMAGIPAIDAIKICTYNAAKILRRDDKFGSIQPNMSADLLIVKGKPWENISDSRNVEHVFVQGKLLDRQKLLTSWK
jgi:imidazolonepropionase-like amidohydrolase